MGVQQVLHMVGGNGDTSYASNSSVQKSAIVKTMPIIEAAIANLCSNTLSKSIEIADLGCSSGPNALFAISLLVEGVEKKQNELGRPLPEFRVFLNDLPGNDFNAIFKIIPQFYEKIREFRGQSADSQSSFIVGIPGSFYERLFVLNSLHFVHSSYSLHFLSQAPPLLTFSTTKSLNKGNIYISKTTPISVVEAYLKQYSIDFSQFLKLRSLEMVSGGQMVLTLLGRTSEDPRDYIYIWDCLAQSLNLMVSEGEIEEDKLDSFNVPFYSPSIQEAERIIKEDGSFYVNGIDIIEMNWDGKYENEDGNFTFDKVESSLIVAKSIRAVSEPLLLDHFGKNLNLDKLFIKFGEIVGEHMSNGKGSNANLTMSLTKK